MVFVPLTARRKERIIFLLLLPLLLIDHCMLILPPFHSKALLFGISIAIILVTFISSFKPLAKSQFSPINGRVSYRAFLSVYRKTDSEILDTYGKPDNEEPAIRMKRGFWPAANEADFNWLYNISEQYTVVLSFRDHRCFSVHLSDYREHLHYQHWKAELIGSFAERKTAAEILAKFGAPTSKSGPIRLEGWSKEAREADETWHYETGYSTCEMLTFKNGRCTSVEQLAIFH